MYSFLFSFCCSSVLEWITTSSSFTYGNENIACSLSAYQFCLVFSFPTLNDVTPAYGWALITLIQKNKIEKLKAGMVLKTKKYN